MSQFIDVEISFQGGGAKLASLIAIADAAFNDLPKLNLRVSSVSGTSAGAIAAAMLASGVNPSLYKARLHEIAPKYLKRLSWKTRWLRVAVLPMLGLPVLSKNFLEDFLADLFTIGDKKIHSVGDLKMPISIFSTDIGEKKSLIKGNNTQDSLPEILAESAAIPILFHGYASKSNLVDGGLVNNLPVSHRAKQPAELSRLIAVTFYEEKNGKRRRNPVSYAKALISTSIDSHVYNSIDSLPDVNVHTIRTKTGTFDFKKAVDDDLSETFYGAYKESFVSFATSYKASFIRNANHLTAGKVIGRILDHHERIVKRSSARVERAIYRYVCNCLKHDDPRREDLCEVEYVVVPETEEFTSFGLQHLSGNEFYQIGDIEVTVKDEANGQEIPCSTFSIPPEYLKGRSGTNNLIIQFDAPLLKDRRYRFIYQVLANQVLYDLKTEKRDDEISFAVVNMNEVEEVDLIAFVPAEMSDFNIAPLGQPGAKDSEHHKEGKRLTTSELKEHGTRVGFRSVGWRASRLAKGQWTGFIAVSRRTI